MWAFFDTKIVLNVPSATERYSQTVRELSRVGIADYNKFEAIPANSPYESFNRSMFRILINFLRSEGNVLLILEDDVVFIDYDNLVCSRISAALQQLPAYWDILYLGANLNVEGFQKPLYYSPNLCKIYNAWTTHAVAFTRVAAKRIVKLGPPITDGMFDSWLSNHLKDFNTFCISPMVAMQRPGKSLIWGNNVNYDPVFIESNNILIQTK